MSKLLDNGCTGSHRKMSEEQLKIHNKKAAEEWDMLNKTFERIVLFEKHEPYKLLFKMGWLSQNWIEENGLKYKK